MAESSPLDDFLLCPVCWDIFRNPVSLGCHHSFCSSCLNKSWDEAKKKNCPVCRTRSSKDNPGVNLSLRNLADSFAGRKKAGPSGKKREKVWLSTARREEAGSSGERRNEEEVEVACSKHTEEPKWFCEEEQRAVCHVCESPELHKHKLVPLEQAVNDLKEKLMSDLESLQDKEDKYERVEKTYQEVVQHRKKQLVATEKRIRMEFEKLHQFLREEEEVRLSDLREEEEEKGGDIYREMNIIQDQISSLSASISAVEQDLQKQKVSFLTSYKLSQTSTRAQVTLPDPQLVSGALIDVAKHLGNLTFRVWEKMKEVVKFTPVILDPNTADSGLSLSDDLTSVGRHGPEQQLPDNPERNTRYTTVLGSEGFSSGKHSWEVEVGDHPDWNIGVARESVDRKGERSASPFYGIWCILQRSGKYTNGYGEPLPLKRRAQRIRVQLDCDRGEVSFYDPEDMTHIYTHKDTFTEKIYPYFGIGAAGDAKHPDVKILQSEVSVSVMSCDHSFCERRSSKNNPGMNFSSMNLVDSIAGTSGLSAERREDLGLSGEMRKEEEEEAVCSKHTEEPKWFCEEEQRVVCHVCESPELHKHKLVPLEQAVNDLKEKLKSDLQSLKDKEDKYKHVENTYREVVQHRKKQLVATEKRIRLEFEKLHQLLREEEEARLSDLRKEEEEKGDDIPREINIIQDQISSLTASISAVEQDLQKQKVSFLTSYKLSQTSTRAQLTLPDPQLVSGALIDVAKHLGNLTFRVWEKMKEVVKFTPVILDPNTACPCLSLSDGLTSVGQHGPKQQLPDNPERNTMYATVLGSEGFSSGKHSWEVEVGDLPIWAIGVVRESVDRKGECSASPKDGFWCIRQRSGKYTNGFVEPLPLKRSPQRIRVQLDCDRGEVSFYDPEDMTHIYTHKITFTEKIYPYFSIGPAGDAKHPDVKILQSEVSVAVMSFNHSFCERRSSTKNPGINFSSMNLADSIAGRKTSGLSAEKREEEEEEEEEEVVCSKHTEEPKWFCEEEQRTVCHVCESPELHKHKLVPLEQAVNDLKVKVKSDIQSLKDKQHKYKRVEKTYKEVVQQRKKQLVATEKRIRLEFEKLHQFLREEEEARLSDLREEEEEKGDDIYREINIIQDQLSSLTASISAVEQDLQKQKVPFLTSYKLSQTSTRAQVTLPDPQLVSGALIDVAKHLGNLTFRVWEKMKEVVKFTPVILDPNTAHPCLSLSDDLTSMGQPGTWQQLPNNPERITRHATVLGSEGFSSGKHSWEVEVGDHPVWGIGVARESVDRKGGCSSSPKDGVWCIFQRSGEYINGCGEPLPLKRSPQRIRVQLDCDRGEVSFYDPEDMTHIYTHKDTFTEKMYPFFDIGPAGDAKHPDVKILQSELSVSVMSCDHGFCERRSSKNNPGMNFSLMNLADSIAGMSGLSAEGREDLGLSAEMRKEEDEGEVEVVCSKHTEEPKWFCEEEQRAMCHVCESPELHKHKLVPLEQAVNDLKEKLKSDLQSLKDKQHKYKHVENTYREVVQHRKKQLVATEKRIRLEFDKLHQFLREEEEARLTDLREEEEEKGDDIYREMKIIQNQISSLSASISAVEQDLQKQNVSFLTRYKLSQTSTRAQLTLPDPQLVSGALIDVAKHLGNLTFRVWEKMNEVVKFTPVILDPNTANACLSLSDDLTSVGRPGPWQQLPDNPERNTRYPIVLGSEGFSSGKHSWEVDVGDHPDWEIGVARESVDRKGGLVLSPEYGLWCMMQRSGTYKASGGGTLPLKRKPQRIRVQLDCDRGEVSFYDPEDMTHIYTHKDTFTEKIYPYFDIGPAGDAKHPDVKILQSELSVSVMSCDHGFCERRSSKNNPGMNFSLMNLADSIAGMSGLSAEGREDLGLSAEMRKEEDEGEVEVVCSKHTEEPKWFCEEEQRAVCHVCESPELHKHKLVPLEQAVNDLKEKLKSDLQSLKDKEDKYKHVENTYREVVQHCKKQLVATEKQIKMEFDKLHQFLREEEEARLSDLREEEEEKGDDISREMKIIQDQISSLSASISAVEQDLQKQKVSFLTSYKLSQTSTRAQVTLPDPQLVSGALIDMAKHLGNLTFRVWEKMKEVVKFTPVILDPNNAHYNLSLSDDLTSVGQRGPKQQLPDNPERNTMYPTVLGSEGFSSGKHSWEVEVGDHPDWTIGVARESVDRKGELLSESPKYGVWCITQRSGKYSNGCGEPLPLKRSPQRIRVHLDCDRGEVSFYDPEDMTHIYTHKDTFTEKIYPYFGIGAAGDAKHPDVKILQSEVSVSVMSCDHSFCERRSSKNNPGMNFSSINLADSIAGTSGLSAERREKRRSSSERREDLGLSGEMRKEEEVLCSKHTEEPKSFCEEELRAVCHVCESPELHKHKLVPLEQAVNDLKEKVKSDLQSLQDKQNKYKHVEKTYQEVVQHRKKQLVATEKQIKMEFEKLHQFLREEEEARLSDLREEEEEKGDDIYREMKIIQDQISSLTASIFAVEQDLQKQKVLFLTSYKLSQTSTRAQVTLPDPQLVSGALIDVAKHLGNLTFRVWEKMKEVVKFTPVILDPNTAHRCLSLSDDLTSVGQPGSKQQLPDNPERITKYPTVLGSEGFSSGKHSWEVEVGDHPDWDIGVARESVDRKGEISESPKVGIRCIVQRNGKYTNGLGKTLPLKRRAQRIRVQLDCDRGEVSFYEPEDMTHIYTHKDTFTEKIYPFFDIGAAGDAKHPDVKILQSELSVSVMSCHHSFCSSCLNKSWWDQVKNRNCLVCKRRSKDHPGVGMGIIRILSIPVSILILLIDMETYYLSMT